MNLIPARISLKLSWPYQLFGVVIISLIAWGQVGFTLGNIRLLFIATNYLCWFFLLPWINGWVHSQTSWKSTMIPSSVAQFLMILIAHWIVSNTIFYMLRFVLLDYALLPTGNEVLGYLLPSLLSRIIDLSLFAALLAWSYQNSLLHDQKMEVSEKETELQRSRLQSLKNQLNPHFLFNSMHNIASLIGQDNDAAHELITKVSHLLRKIMIINEKEQHTLQDEWDFVQDYLAIESERFQDRLTLDLSFDERLKNRIVPTLILQPLVENAFKHGISHAVNPTKLSVSISHHDNYDAIQVSNEVFEGSRNVTSNRVGLRNLEDRLHTYYNGNATLKTESGDSTFSAMIKLPHL